MALSTEKLPVWDLSHLYPGMESAELKQNLSDTLRAATAFERQYKGRLAELSAAELAGAIEKYEWVVETRDKIAAFARLQLDTDSISTLNNQFFQSVKEQLLPISRETIFFKLELNWIDDSNLKAKCADLKLGRWTPWLQDLRKKKPHQLSKEVEEVLDEQDLIGREAWIRLYDARITQIPIAVRDEALTVSDALNKLRSSDRTLREETASALSTAVQDDIKIFTFIMNMLLKNKQYQDDRRKYSHPASYRNLQNGIDDEVVKTLVREISRAYPRLTHRYFRKKAELLDLGQLMYWDMNAPPQTGAERRVSWSEAKSILLGVYESFHPQLAEIISEAFDKQWIDAEPRMGKFHIAYSYQTVPNVHPYLLINYHGGMNDLNTLSHEMGHCIHQVLARAQGHLMSNTPVTLNEIPSFFSELLTFDYMLNAEKDEKIRTLMLERRVHSILNDIVHQVTLHQFEERLHLERRNNELSPEQISKLWIEVQAERCGTAVSLDQKFANHWATIPHFIQTPFYIYGYAFSYSVALVLYNLYRKGHNNFTQKYIELLKAGITKPLRELLEPFGLDPSDSSLWERSVQSIEDLMDQLDKSRSRSREPEHRF